MAAPIGNEILRMGVLLVQFHGNNAATNEPFRANESFGESFGLDTLSRVPRV